MPPVRFLAGSIAVAAALAAWPSAAQVSRPVVQAVAGGDAARLNAALGRLARNPRDIDALIEAGSASLRQIVHYVYVKHAYRRHGVASLRRRKRVSLVS